MPERNDAEENGERDRLGRSRSVSRRQDLLGGDGHRTVWLPRGERFSAGRRKLRARRPRSPNQLHRSGSGQRVASPRPPGGRGSRTAGRPPDSPARAVPGTSRHAAVAPPTGVCLGRTGPDDGSVGAWDHAPRSRVCAVTGRRPTTSCAFGVSSFGFQVWAAGRGSFPSTVAVEVTRRWFAGSQGLLTSSATRGYGGRWQVAGSWWQVLGAWRGRCSTCNFQLATCNHPWPRGWGHFLPLRCW
jgi:hypothetical protein